MQSQQMFFTHKCRHIQSPHEEVSPMTFIYKLKYAYTYIHQHIQTATST